MRNQFYWGVVENRNDPLKLGRYQVRVVGVHSPNKSDMPTSDLPWATTIQPTTSAGVSGIGQNPGLVQGSWVLVIFTSDDLQVPVILGSVAGIPGMNNLGAVPEESPVPTPEEATPSQKKAGVAEGVYEPSVLDQGKPYLGSLTEAQFKDFANYVRIKESQQNYSAVNTIGYMGAYQFGAMALEDLGYLKKGTWAKYKKNKAATDESSNWTGKDGVTDRNQFLTNQAAQDNCFLLLAQRNYKIMSGKGQVNAQTDPRVLAGLLGVAHNQGAGSVTKFLAGNITKDGYGTSSQTYYDHTYRSVKVLQPGQTDSGMKPNNDTDPAPVPNAEEIAPKKPSAQNTDQGFTDPENKYPTWPNEADIHRVVRGQKIAQTIVKTKEDERKKNIGIALSDKSWDQPPIPYGVTYPYNHAMVSESGHMLEFDDSPNNERVHLYHKSGTFLEIDNVGNQVNKIEGHGVTIVEQDGYISIKGNGHIRIDGHFTLHGDNAFIEMSNINIKSKKTVWHTESFHMKAETDFIVETGKAVLKSSGLAQVSGKTTELKGDSKVSIKSGGNVGIDGKMTHLNSGMASISSPGKASDLEKFEGDVVKLESKSFEESDNCATENTPEAVVVNADAAAEAPPVKEAAVIPAATPPAPTNTTSCETFDLAKGDSIVLSPKYKVKDLCRDGAFNFSGQHNLTPQEILCNMQKLCQNVIEPCAAKFGGKMKINSGFRPAGSKVSHASGISQHELGMAVDIGFTSFDGMSKQEFVFNAAAQIQQLVPFDQLLLEYTSAGWAWVHVSFKVSGNRGNVMTFNNHKKHKDGLVLIK